MPKDSRSLLRTPQNEDVVGKCRESNKCLGLANGNIRVFSAMITKVIRLIYQGDFLQEYELLKKKQMWFST